MQMSDKVLTALEVLRDAAENDFERRRIDMLEHDLTSPPVAEQIDDTHQKFNGEIYSKNKQGHYHRHHGLHRAVWAYYNGEIPAGFDVHHKNEDKGDNSISNLEIKTRSDHRKSHANPRVEKTCPVCGKKFVVEFHQRNLICCSSKCGNILTWQTRKSKNPPIEKVCPVCGKTFTAYKKTQIFCSRQCVAENKRKNLPRTCPICGKVFTPPSKTSVYCSRSCASKAIARQRHKITPETPKTC